MKYLLIITICILCATFINAEVSITIDHAVNVSPGDYMGINIYFENSPPLLEMGGFDLLLVHYPFLSVQSVVEGQLLNDCQWEYFTYNTNQPDELRLIALADQANGPVHPSCYGGSSGILATIIFKVHTFPPSTNFLPIQWIWYDCGDNTVSSRDGNNLYISNDVYDFDGSSYQPITENVPFPTLNGAPDACLSGTTIERMVDFYNGGVSRRIVDTIPPTATCPGDISVNNDPGFYGAFITFTASVDDDNPGATISCDPVSGTYFPIGTTLGTCIAVDAVGNADTCYFNVTVALNDPDGDGLPDWDDNCPNVYNPDQTDTDDNGIGDSCCCVLRGNVNSLDGSSGQPIDVTDLTYLIAFLFAGGPPPPCPEQGNVDAQTGASGPIDVADMTYLIEFLYKGGPDPLVCE